MKTLRHLALLVLLACTATATVARAAIVTATYSAATDVPVTASSYTATGDTVTFTLNYAPATGTQLMVVNNTGLGFISGTFSNLAQGQAVALSFGGTTYNFVANYFGGTGNDLVLQWASSRAFDWGHNDYGQLGNNSTTGSTVPLAVTTTGVLAGKTVTAVAAGDLHSLALCSDGTLAAWGYNFFGQLGNNSTTERRVPVAVTVTGVLAGKTVTAVSAGRYHSLALCSDGTLAAWGSNSNGQLGNNGTTNSSVPVAVIATGVLAGKTVIALAAGDSHSLALCSDGTLATWGYNLYGQLGNNSTTQSTVPVTVNTTGVLAGKTVIAVAAGSVHSLALCSDGTVASWGYNSYGQLGNNSTTQSTVPVTVDTTGVLAGKTVIAVAAGGLHCLALCSDGTLATWGSNLSGHLGNGSPTGQSTVPVGVTATGVLAGKTATGIAAGRNHSLVRCADGTLVAWGANSNGQLGDNSATQSTVPVEVTATGVLAGKTVTSLAAGESHSLALCADGTLAAWGWDSYGQLGNNGKMQNAVPVAVTATGVLAGKTVTTVAAGDSHSLALCSDGTLAAWGYNLFGQLGNNSPTNSSVPVAVTATGVLAGKTVIAVSVGQNHSLALCSDGTLAAWGDNLYGQLGDNSTTSRPVPVAVTATGVLAGKTVIAVAAGGSHSLALCSDGTLAAWGYNFYGQLGNNSTTNSRVPVAVTATGVLAGKTVTAVSAGRYHSLALCSDGTLASWGYNSNGQLGNNSTAQSTVPVAVTAMGVLAGKTVIAVSAGEDHSLALCSDGTLAAWGYNFYGQLGNNSTIRSRVPVLVTSTGVLAGKTVTAVAAGNSHSLALCSDGTLAAWGYNFYGQLGNNSTTQSTVPVLVSTAPLAAGERIVASASGSSAYHSLALVASPPPTVPDAPSIGTATGGNAFATLSFTAPASDGGAAITSYTVTSNPGGITSIGTGSPILVSGLTNGTSYTFTVTATNAAGTSAPSEASNAVTPAVINVTATYSTGNEVPVTSNGFTATGGMANLTLNYAPSVGTSLMVVQNTSQAFIQGSFSNLAQGQAVALNFGGTTYHFVADYFGGSGNDLVLRWAGSRVFDWGRNDYGQLGNNSTSGSQVPLAVPNTGGLAGKTVIAVSAGESHSLALCSDGTLATWGSNLSGQLGNNSITLSSVPVAVPMAGVLANKTVIAVAAGQSHSLALCSDGTLVAWGNNSIGQLGNNSTTNSSEPVAVTTTGVLAGKTVIAVAAGSSHSLALCSDGTLAAWGSNNSGQLGNNSTTQSTVPVAVTTTGVLAGKTVTAISAGASHSLVLYSDGTLASWGLNSSGQLGNSSTAQSTVPVTVTATGVLAGKTVTAVSAGGTHNLVRCSDGTLAAWGANSNGQLGNNSATQSTVPVAVIATGVLAGKTVSAVVAGTTHSFALCSDGTLAAWGRNHIGQLGNNSVIDSMVPVDVTGAGVLAGKTVTTIDGGATHSLALCSDGTLATWGSNGYGQAGNNSATNSSEMLPVTATGVLAGKTVTAVAAGGNHSLALCADGTLAAWGFNSSGQLGNNSTAQSTVPVAVTTTGLLAGKTVIAVAAGGSHNLALCSDGSLAAWGINSSGQLGNNSTTNSSVPVAVTITGVLASKTVIAVAASSSHSLALCSDGTLAAWGRNSSGQLGNNSTTNSSVPVAVSATGVLAGKAVIAVSAADAHSLALCSDGTLAAWGNNSFGQLGTNSTTSSTVPVAVTTTGLLAGKTVIAVSAGFLHSLALCADGTVAAWGANSNGQLGDTGTTGSTVPVAVNATGVLAGKTVIAVDAGFDHSLALCSDGTLVAWGRNLEGQLGNNSTTRSSVPVLVSTAPLATGERLVASASGPSAYHSLAIVAAPPTTVPGAPTIGIATAGDASASVAFTAPATDGGAAITGYTVTSSPGGFTATGTVSPITVGGLASGTSYTFTVTATNAVGTSAASAASNAVTTTAPEIAIEQPTGSPLTGQAVEFGSQVVSTSTGAKSFSIKNTGTAALTISSVSVVGGNAADFIVNTSGLLSSVPFPTGETTFAVTFAPSAPGPRQTTLRVVSNDNDEGTYDVTLTGQGMLNAAAQTIAFSPAATVYLSQSPLALVATASSGLPVTLSVLSGPASITGNVLALTGAGTVKVQATQAGGGNYAAAAAVVRTIAVKADPTTMVLLDLAQTYNATPRPIGTLGASGAVISYKVGGVEVSTPPTNAGSYPVKAVAGSVTKTGTLVIAKAMLTVKPQDKRRLAGQANPALTLTIRGFAGGDNESALRRMPVAATTAKINSPGGTYPITASGGDAANYGFIYQQSSMVVESFAGDYEALLVDGSALSVGKLAITVAANSKDFTGKLFAATETTALALKGSLTTDTTNELGTGTASVTKAGVTYAVSFTMDLAGLFTASCSRSSLAFGSASDGSKLLVLAAGEKVSYAGAHTAVLAPASPAAVGVPAGAGWATATVATTGALTLAGKLGDGTAFTTVVAADAASDPGYRCFAQPYLAARAQAYLAGAFSLTGHPSLADRRYNAGTALTWRKAGLVADASYRAGFAAVTTVMTIDPWLTPVAGTSATAAITFAERLGLTGTTIAIAHSASGSASDVNLPTSLKLSATNTISVLLPVANVTNWKTLTFSTVTGRFTGSYEVIDGTLKRPVTFSGILRQPADELDTVIGDGHYLLPPTTGTEKLTGEVLLQRP